MNPDDMTTGNGLWATSTSTTTPVPNVVVSVPINPGIWDGTTANSNGDLIRQVAHVLPKPVESPRLKAKIAELEEQVEGLEEQVKHMTAILEEIAEEGDDYTRNLAMEALNDGR